MQKRTLTVLAIAAFAGTALPFGLPKDAAAAPLVVGYNSIVMSPLPIAQPGTLIPPAVSTNTVTMCVQPQENGAKIAPGATVFLSIDAGLFTSPTASGGSAVSGSTTLTSTPQSFVTVDTCTFSSPGGSSGTVNDAVPLTYTGPNPVPVNGRDVIAAESDASSFNATTGQCTGPGVCGTGTYVFSPVASYTFSPAAPTIAPPGTLTAGQTVPITVTALDGPGGTGHPVPGAFIDISLTSTAASGGSATGVNSFDGNQTQKVTNLPTRFGATNAGTVLVTYAAANPLPASGVDTITAQNHPTETVEASTSYTYGSTVAFSQAPFTPVTTPFRLCDTRPHGGSIPLNQCNEPGQGSLGSGAVRTIQATGVTGSGVPLTGVSAVVLNVTAIQPNTNTFITVYPAGAGRPATSNLNPLKGSIVANLVEVGVNGSGQIDVFNDVGVTGLIVDIEGYVNSGTSTGLYKPIATPVRICDTRAAGSGVIANQCDVGGTHPINGGASLAFNIDAQSDGVPTSASAVVFNLTAISPSNNTVLTAYAGGTSAPNASNLNLSAHEVLPNRVVVPVGAGGVVDIKNSVGSVNVAVDIDGYFQTGTGSQFTALPTPARVCNTSTGTSDTAGCVKAAVTAGGVLNIFVDGIDGIPALGAAHQPTALVVNVTGVNASSSTFITVYPGPAGAGRPTASDLNLLKGQTVPNLVFVGVGADGSINLFNDLGNVNLIVDVLGYYS